MKVTLHQNTTNQLVEWKTIGVAIMIGVGENSATASAFGLDEGLDFFVVLSVQRSLTHRFSLE